MKMYANYTKDEKFQCANKEIKVSPTVIPSKAIL